MAGPGEGWELEGEVYSPVLDFFFSVSVHYVLL